MRSIIFPVFFISLIMLSLSCNDDTGSNNNKAIKLLPQKISIEYGASDKRVLTYDYDKNRRLTGYTETNIFGNSIELLDIETICKITYNEENQIDSLIITPRLLNDNNTNNIAYLPVNDTILFKHNDKIIKIKRKNKKDEEITINSKGEAIFYKYYGDTNAGLQITNTYLYDHKGNITDITINNGSSASYTPYKYFYDNKNGIFSHVNTPEWFLLIMLNQDLNYTNNFNEYTDYEGNKCTVRHIYNDNDYPVFSKIESPNTNPGVNSATPIIIEYITGD